VCQGQAISALPYLVHTPNRAIGTALVEVVVSTQGSPRVELLDTLLMPGHAPGFARQVTQYGVG